MDEKKQSDTLAKLIARAKRSQGLSRSDGSPSPASGPATVYDGLFARYRRAYGAAVGLKALAVLNMVVGGLAVLLGMTFLSKETFGGTVGGLTMLAWGGAAILAGMALNGLASILTVLIDRTAFAAPGLTDQERLNLVFKATGNVPPRIKPEQPS